ncbi:arginine--tRNA ligase [Caldisericum exile]|uniref:Arginine--tRNA ligase n=1 Tax=Caldisericum exile (strain DSM 21853 / NBRC 104410 / AZM16c01) TaxID=511051 RepID=A0A7U6JGP3_CALEA|nr:arginine--tRNA ligase [Caldisericum exile]BAL80557.1 arginyl-tRNA synthetase [Caldisericum exile AZM16c01]
MNIYKLQGEILEALSTPLKDIEFDEDFKLLIAPFNFGDFSLNIAFKLAKVFKKSPKDISDELIKYLNLPYFESLSNDQGYINIRLGHLFYRDFLKELLDKKDTYFKKEPKYKKIQVEFVSANPTGPLHVGNGRGGVIGDVVSNVLKSRGFEVEKEYYVNDAGNKMDLFAQSIRYWYLKNFYIETDFPEEGYAGDYIKRIADVITEVFKNRFVNYDYKKQIEVFKVLGEYILLGDANSHIEELEILKKNLKFDFPSILESLKLFGVYYDNIFFESSLYEGKLVKVEEGLELPEKLAEILILLKERNLLYKKDGAWWFKATEFKDDKDRVLVKASGEPTYTLTDIAYHVDKFRRGNIKAIDVWGADHFGHVITMKALLNGVGIGGDFLDVILYQIVHFFENGSEVMMSKHTGKFYPLSDLVLKIGKDAARFFFLVKSADTHLNFDIDLALKQSLDNPVFYIQYTFARLHNIVEEAKKRGVEFVDFDAVLNEPLEPVERKIFNSIFYINSILDDIAFDYSIHRIPNFTLDLARDINFFYQNYRVLSEENPNLRTKRFLLVQASLVALGFMFDLMGIEKKEHM